MEIRARSRLATSRSVAELVLSAALSVVAAPVTAATITWGPVQNTTAPAVTDVVNTFSAVQAINYGPSSGTVTVNGVVFTNTAADVGNWWDPGPYSGNADYDTIFAGAQVLAFGAGVTGTLTLSGLTNGQDYRIQLINIHDQRPCCGARSYEIDDESADYVGAPVMTRNLGGNVVGTFTASGTTQVIRIRSLGGVDNNDPALAAWVLSEVNDADGDGVEDGVESAAGTNPGLVDTDGDGLCDGQKVVGACTGNEVALDSAHSLLFAGGQRVVVPHAAALNSSNMTWEAWIRPTAGSFEEGILSKGPGWGQTGRALFNLRGGKLSFYDTSLGWLVAATTVPLDEWSHVAVTRTSGGTLRFYLNGRLDGTVNGVQVGSSGTDPFRIGVQGIYNPFDGNIDEVRVWNVVRSEAQIRGSRSGDPTGTPGLVGYWRMEEGAGQLVVDATGSHPGTLGDGTGTEGADPAWAGGQAHASTDPTLQDTDGDGLCDGFTTVGACDGNEGAVGADPTTADTDGDGLCDGSVITGACVGTEVGSGTDPTLADTDGDGFPDSTDPFPTDGNACGDVDGDSCDDCSVAGTSDPANDGSDIDGDGLCDAGDADIDGDGLPNTLEDVPRFGTPAAPVVVSGILAVDARLADLDGNGSLDVLTLDNNTGVLAWFSNDGAGVFSAPASSTIEPSAGGFSVATFVADLDGDGFRDVLLACSPFGGLLPCPAGTSGSIFDPHVLWYRNDGAGGFSVPSGAEIDTAQLNEVIVADVNGDTYPDVIGSGPSAPELGWYANDGAGNFGVVAGIATPFSSAPSALFAVGLDGDPDLDLVAGNSSELGVFANDGSGSFTATSLVGSGAFVPVDVDGDGDVDIVRSDLSATTWLRNDGSGNFSAPPNAAILNTRSFHMVALDVEGDGDQDLVVVVGVSGNEIQWLENDGTGSFSTPANPTLSINWSVTALAAGDLDGDGDPDILLSNTSNSQVRWIENQTGDDARDPDRDGDGLCDGPATVAGVCVGGEDLNANGSVEPSETDPSLADTDLDLLCDGSVIVGGCTGTEVAAGSDPKIQDTDGDGLCDGTVTVGSCVGNEGAGGTNAASADTDGDGLCDAGVAVAGVCAGGYEDVDADGVVDPGETDPNLADTDGDLSPDGTEISAGTNPLVPDTDGDGLLDGQEPGALVFVTSTTTAGDFGGLAGGDAICEARAAAAGLSTGFRAWLSDASTDASTRIPDQVYKRTDGAVAASGLAQLTSATLASSIDFDELGAAVPFGSAVWTGTTSAGSLQSGATCGDWTDSGLTGGAGVTNFVAAWTQAVTNSCTQPYRLYCFDSDPSTDALDPDTDGDGLCDGDTVVSPCVGTEAALGTDPLDADTDGDGLDDATDPAPLDEFACADVDADTCDDCSVLGTPDPANDGPDNDLDGLCDAGDPDDDDDGTPDGSDPCPLDPLDACVAVTVPGPPAPLLMLALLGAGWSLLRRRSPRA